MRLVVFGLTVSSSWGNGHATLWRGLAAALHRAGHALTFFERDVPWYAAHRDLTALPGGALELYSDPAEVRARAVAALREADVGIVTSYCPDARAAEAWLGDAGVLRVFYDLDPGVTLQRTSVARASPSAGRPGVPAVPWLGPRGLRDYDLVLSFTGGRALEALSSRLGARRVAPLYGSVDPEVHRPAPAEPAFRGDLSYLGTWAASRQPALDALFLGPAARFPERAFVLAGAMYPADFAWRSNVRFVRHLEPALHPAFFCSSPLTLSVTRPEMAALGHCPSGRLFEAAACGVPVLSDWFDGLPAFFTPGEEVLVARGAEDVARALALAPEALRRIGAQARERALAAHSAAARSAELLARCEAAAHGAGASADAGGLA